VTIMSVGKQVGCRIDPLILVGFWIGYRVLKRKLRGVFANKC